MGEVFNMLNFLKKLFGKNQENKEPEEFTFPSEKPETPKFKRYKAYPSKEEMNRQYITTNMFAAGADMSGGGGFDSGTSGGGCDSGADGGGGADGGC